MRFTPPVQVIYALRQAIDEYFEEGGLKRYKRYTKNWRTLKKGLQRLNFEFLLNPDDESHILLTVIEPDDSNYNFNKIHDLLYEKGFTIYPGKITKRNTFRIAVMGDIDENDILQFINNLRGALIKLGVIDYSTGEF